MKIYYLNDEQKPVTVKVMDDTWDHTYKDDNQKNYHVLKSCESKVFDVVCPQGAILYVKKWPNMVMISYMMSSDLPQEDDQYPRSGAV